MVADVATMNFLRPRITAARSSVDAPRLSQAAPSAQGEPRGRLVSVPAVLVRQDHFHDVVAEAAERREEFRKQAKGQASTPGLGFLAAATRLAARATKYPLRQP